jgi:predicted benzoate:H+ symporter BenE
VYPERENEVILPLISLGLRAPCKARWVWAGAVILASATCPLQFAEAIAATLPQQEKSDPEGVQR